MSEVKDYSKDLQKLFVQFMVTDPELYTRVRGIIKADYFDRSLSPVIKKIIKHTEEYSSMPTEAIIKAETGIDIEKLTKIYLEQSKQMRALEAYLIESMIQKSSPESAQRFLNDLEKSHQRALEAVREFRRPDNR